MTRRSFIRTLASIPALTTVGPGDVLRAKEPPATLADRIRGLILGSALGDALGGPIEFQDRDKIQSLPDPPRIWKPGERLDAVSLTATAGRLRLRPYAPLRRDPESYGMWNPDSAAGTITDDTRHKLLLLHALHQVDHSGAWPMNVEDLARAYLDWPGTEAVLGRPGYPALAADWLEEWQLAARWILGERAPSRALPPSRMWQGLPTVCGQMALLPLAALFPGRPDDAYRAAYALAFSDNGYGKDLNAALIAGLAQALVLPSSPDDPGTAFAGFLEAVRKTDPLRHRAIRWSQRALDRWLDRARHLARAANHEPARLFAALDQEFEHAIKWEAQVALVVAVACLELAHGHPLAALQLSLEWGHDSDSYAQVVGAIVGALHGASIFPADWIRSVVHRLRVDHGVDLEAECQFLTRLPGAVGTKPLIAGP